VAVYQGSAPAAGALGLWSILLCFCVNVELHLWAVWLNASRTLSVCCLSLAAWPTTHVMAKSLLPVVLKKHMHV
jgi:hypothetical protein